MYAWVIVEVRRKNSMFFWVFFLFFSYSTPVVLVHEAEHLWCLSLTTCPSVQSRWQAKRKEHRNALIHGFNHAYPCAVLLSDQGEVGIIKWRCVPSCYFIYLQSPKSSKAALSLLRSMEWWMASTDCLESPQISRNCGERLTLFIYFQYVVVNISFQLCCDDISYQNRLHLELLH